MTRLSHRLRLVSGAALAALAASLLLVVPASGAASTGTLRVNLVDGSGAPVAGRIMVAPQGSSFVTTDTATGTASHDFTLEPGSYGLVVLTHWGGATCAGVAPCSAVPTGMTPVTGAVAVVAETLTTYTLTVAVDTTLVGTPAVGKTLSVQLNPGLAAWDALIDGVYDGLQYQWLRDGTAIPGATTYAYVPTLADAGRRLSVRLGYTGPTVEFLADYIGSDPTPRVLGPVGIPKVATKTFIALSRSPITVKQQTTLRVDVVSGDDVVSGTVVVTIGKKARTHTLRNGRTSVKLKGLKKGTYVVRVTYRGSTTFQPSTSPKKKLVVTAASRR